VTDANVLINLLHAGLVDLLGGLPGYEFVAPDHVIEEVTAPAQRATLDDAVTRRVLKRESITDIASIELYAELRGRMGSGEAACIAMAAARRWLIASDEKGAFRQEVVRRLGAGSLITTAGLLVLAIRADRVTVEQADQAKAVLEQHRFRMKFGSFRDLVGDEREGPSKSAGRK
jgi:predicted nucleic acid-binding protein